MTAARTAVALPASGVGGCLREGVARRPRMAGGMGTDESRLAVTVNLSNQPRSAHGRATDWVENRGRSIKGSETPY